MNLLDQAIDYFSPRWSLKRKQARTAATMLRKYDAASTATRVSGWNPSGSSADAEIGPALVRLRNRARDLCRNNEYAKRARNAIASYIVGAGIVPQAKGNSARAKKLNTLWDVWGETIFCDFDGHNNFYGLQSLLCGTIVESGACLVKRVMRRPTADNPIGLEIQLLEPDFIEVSTLLHQVLPNGGYIKQGVEFDADGKKVAYHLYKDHPGESLIFRGVSLVRVPITELSHVFWKERPGQTHGVPWLTAVAMRLKDYADYEDAQLIRQKIAACFAGFIRDIEMPDSTDQSKIMPKVEPGRLEMLPPGKDIVFATPPGVSGYGEYGRATKQAIAAGLDITYEALTSDLSQVNFSSARIGQGDMYRHVDAWQWQMVVPHFCEEVWAWFETACDLAGLLPGSNTVGANWTPPKREFIDPAAETEAIKAQVRSGFKTPSEAVREYGYDPQTHWDEYAKDLEKLDSLGIKLDIDARNGPGSGASMPKNQAAPAQEPKQDQVEDAQDNNQEQEEPQSETKNTA
jgi:lambda family phage portal protein